MSVREIIHKHPNKDAVGVVEAAIHAGAGCKDFDVFLVELWKSDGNRPEIYQRKASAVPHNWMDQLEVGLQARDYNDNDKDKDKK